MLFIGSNWTLWVTAGIEILSLLFLPRLMNEIGDEYNGDAADTVARFRQINDMSSLRIELTNVRVGKQKSTITPMKNSISVCQTQFIKQQQKTLLN